MSAPIRAWTVRTFIPALLLLSAGCASTSALHPKTGPHTRAEASAYLETSRYSDVVAFLDSLRGRTGLTFGSIGRTNEGRELPYVIASRPAVTSPEEARALRRPIVYVQGNIHAGEVEGKEALLALLRDLSASRKPNALDSVILIAVPIYNADGNERIASQSVNRQSQDGPELVGVRANAQGLDLNRDYVKVEAPETRASLAMFNRWNPDVFVDLHTTNGSYHGYALTYSPPLNPASFNGAYARDSTLPVIRERMRAKHGFETFDYGDFISDDTLSRGWTTFDSRPRYGTNYYGLRGRISILSEAYSHDPFRRRVESTHAFVGEILSLVAERGRGIMERSRLADTRLSGSGRTVSGQTVAVRSELVAAPGSRPVIAEIMERTGDTLRTGTGVRRGFRRTGRYQTVTMPIFDRFRPTLERTPPRAYALKPTDTAAVKVLRLHGISVEQLPTAISARMEIFVVDSIARSARAFQGHNEVGLTGRWRSDTGRIPASSWIVRTDQPLGVLALYLLEPESDDGLATWNFFDRGLARAAEFPVIRLLDAVPTAQTR